MLKPEMLPLWTYKLDTTRQLPVFFIPNSLV